MDYASCLPEVLYRSGGFFEDQAMLSSLRAFSRTGQTGCRHVADLYEPYQYERQPAEIYATDEGFRASLTQHYGACSETYRNGAASVLVCLEAGLIHNSLLFSRSANETRFVYETNRQNDRPWVEQIDPSQHVVENRTLTKPGMVNFFLAAAGSFNYGHWLVDDLPRTQAIEALQTEAAGRPIRIWITASSIIMDHVRTESLKLLCSSASNLEIRLLRPERVYAFQNLYYATPVTYHPVLKSPAAIRSLRQRLCDDATGEQRIFVMRRDTGTRSLVNLAAIQGLLEARGFQTVDVEAMSFAEQVRTFSGAAVIVGCMGAAMTNCVFARTGTTTIYLGPEGWMEPFYWDLAAVLQHRYVACFGPTQNPALPAHLSSYRIDLDLLGSALDKTLPN